MDSYKKENSLAEHQKILYELLVEFDRVCKQLNIPYMLFAGTMLGVVRHNGFIPWDDDLDIIMLRKDYEKFLADAPKCLDNKKYYLQKEFSEHWPMFYSKLRMNHTTCLEKYNPRDKKCHQGVFIDIFPCDNACSRQFARKIQYYASKIVIAKCLDKRGYQTDSMIKKIFMFFVRIIPLSPCLKIVKAEKTESKWVHSFLGGSSKYEKSVYKKSCFQKSVYRSFEKGQFPISEEYDELLKIMYGNYMQLPPESERECKTHTLLLDLNNSYEKYSGYRDGMKFDTYTRSIR